MAERKEIRVVVVSPSDVQEERDALSSAIDELNSGIADELGLRLSLWRWEADARPGLHLRGVQGVIDALMDIERADVVIGIFWKTIWNPDRRRAVGHGAGAAQRVGRVASARHPDVMVYFSDRPYTPSTSAEARQWVRVLEFRHEHHRRRAQPEAVTIFRELVGSDSELRWGLAAALHNHATGLTEVGRRDDALRAAAESVAIYRDLAVQPLLAITLTQLAALLIAEAPRRAAKVVRISRRLVAHSAGASRDEHAPIEADLGDPDEIVLAMALNNLSICQSHLGRHRRRVAAIEEAVGIYRRFAEPDPARWESRLAEALDNLGIALQAVGRSEDAVLASEESVRRYKDLSVKTAAHTPDLAGALDNLSRNLYLAQRHQEALKASEKAVDVYRSSAAAQPARYGPDLERATYALTALQAGGSPFR